MSSPYDYSKLQPIKVYVLGPSPNPWKTIILLEELGLPYTKEPLSFQLVKEEPYTLLNPNGRAPTIVDPNNNDIAIWETGAIAEYLVETYDPDAHLQYTAAPEKHLSRSWAFFQASGQGPYFGQQNWFNKHHPERLESAVKRYTDEIHRIIGVVDAHLVRHGTDYLVGSKVTYADLMWIPYARMVKTLLLPGLDVEGKWPAYAAWLQRLSTRPGVLRALAQWKAVQDSIGMPNDL